MAITPAVLVHTPAWWEIVIAYGVLLRVPLLLALLLVTLPAAAFLTGARSLLRGLFDLPPLSLFTVTLTALAVAGTICESAFLILAHAHERTQSARNSSLGTAGCDDGRASNHCRFCVVLYETRAWAY